MEISSMVAEVMTEETMDSVVVTVEEEVRKTTMEKKRNFLFLFCLFASLYFVRRRRWRRR
jgi:TATA-binding protein-associated factor Taf7